MYEGKTLFYLILLIFAQDVSFLMYIYIFLYNNSCALHILFEYINTIYSLSIILLTLFIDFIYIYC